MRKEELLEKIYHNRTTRSEEVVYIWLNEDKYPFVLTDKDKGYSKIDGTYLGFYIYIKGDLVKLKESEIDESIDMMRSLDYIQWLKMISNYGRPIERYKDDVIKGLEELIVENPPIWVIENYYRYDAYINKIYNAGPAYLDTLSNKVYDSIEFINSYSISSIKRIKKWEDYYIIKETLEALEKMGVLDSDKMDKYLKKLNIVHERFNYLNIV